MRKIMIADDESLVRIGLQSMLDWEQLGYRITGVFKNGAELWEAAQRDCPDIVLTDIRMPVMDGFELVEKLSSLEKKVHVIILSSYDDFDYTRKALRLGVKDYITKLEVEAGELLRILEQLDYKEPNLEPVASPAILANQPGNGLDPEQDASIMGERGCILAARLRPRQKSYSEEERRALVLLSKEIFYRFRQTDWMEVSEEILYGLCWFHDEEDAEADRWVKWVGEAWASAAEEKLNLLLDISRSELGPWRQSYALLREQAVSRLGSPQEAWVSVILTYIQRHYHEQLRLEDAARKAHLSDNYFSQRFREETGRSFSDYLTDVRITEAKRLLQQPGLSTEEIAERVGYPNANYFVRVFKKATGSTVTAYRKRHMIWN